MNVSTLGDHWDCWFSIGEMECDKYDMWQRVLNDACLPSPFPSLIHPLQLDLIQFEDVPF
jgi:hypothetical protein